MSFAHHPVFIVLLVAVLAPLLSELPVGRRMPVIVFEVVLGIVVGLAFDVGALTRSSETMLLIPILLVLFVAARGLPILLYRHDITMARKPPFALFSSVASLSLIVVITQIGLQTQHMNPDIAQALIAAALLTSLVNLTLGSALLSRAAWQPAPPPG